MSLAGSYRIRLQIFRDCQLIPNYSIMDVSCYALGTTAIITFSSEWFLDYQDNCQKLQHPMQFKTEGLKEKVLQIFPSQQSIYSQRFK